MNKLSTMNETELKKLFYTTMVADFHIAPEVWGVHIIEKQRVRADFIMRPKPHLITAGFDDVYLAAEIKSPGGRDLFKGNQTMWQAATYVQSIFGGKVRPAFGVVFPDLAAFCDAQKHEMGINMPEGLGMRLMAHIGQFMNVGFVELDNQIPNGWSIVIGAQRYFSKRYGKSNLNLIKRYVGNKAS